VQRHALNLDERDEAALAGDDGEGARLAMRVLTRVAALMGAERLLDITGAHIDGCLYHGRAGLDFAGRLVEGGARVRVPTTLNVGSLDLLRPGRYRGDPETAGRARALMDAHVTLGCRPTWTCAPYQLPGARPALGAQVAWGESNAIVFANSVLGARTERYGDFLDLCAAITGRAPDVGLHRDEGRRARIVVRLGGLPGRVLSRDLLFPVLGALVGAEVGSVVPVLDGLPAATEDQLKALGAAAASTGSVAMFHAVGITPEAPTLDAALGSRPPDREIEVTTRDLRRAHERLSGEAGPLDAVSVGTPHASESELRRLAELVAGSAPRIPLYVSTARDVLERAGVAGELEAAGVKIVTDTCTYVTPIMASAEAVMTDSGKWAYYAPGNLGIRAVLGSLEECVRSAAAGRVELDGQSWDG